MKVLQVYPYKKNQNNNRIYVNEPDYNDFIKNNMRCGELEHISTNEAIFNLINNENVSIKPRISGDIDKDFQLISFDFINE